MHKDTEKLEKNPKRHLEKETSDVQERDTVKKPRKKKSSTNQERRHEKRTIYSGFSSDSPFSEESEEDWSVCSAKLCQQPEGNEVSLKCLFMLSYSMTTLLLV